MKTAAQFILAVALLTSGAASAGVHENPVSANGNRLTRKVSYAAAGKHLSNVLSDLSCLTGALLYAGASKTDWQVRDVPLTIAVRDYPLEDLLRAIAAATGTSVTTQRAGKRTARRISHTPRQQRAGHNHEAALGAYAQRLLRWRWDVVARLVNIPEAALRRPETADELWPDRIAAARSVARLLIALGPEGKARILSGEPIVVVPCKAQPALREAALRFVQSALAD